MGADPHATNLTSRRWQVSFIAACLNYDFGASTVRLTCSSLRPWGNRCDRIVILRSHSPWSCLHAVARQRRQLGAQNSQLLPPQLQRWATHLRGNQDSDDKTRLQRKHSALLLQPRIRQPAQRPGYSSTSFIGRHRRRVSRTPTLHRSPSGRSMGRVELSCIADSALAMLPQCNQRSRPGH